MAAASTGLTTATLRAIQALQADHATIVEQLTDQLVRAIELGLLVPGQRLPSEAILSEQLGVATLTLRDALSVLRSEGLLTTRRGRSGGSFIADPASAQPPRTRLARTSIYRIVELGDVRAAIAGGAAALAARRANDQEIGALRRRLGALAAAATTQQRRQADAELALEIAAASQARRFTAEEARLRAELGDVVWSVLGESEHTRALESRERLIDAIAAGDAAGARGLAEEQIQAETVALVRRRIGLYARVGRSHAAPRDGGPHGDSHEDSHGGLAAAIDAALADDLERIVRALEAVARECAAAFEHPEEVTLAGVLPLRPRLLELLEEFSDLAIGLGIIPLPAVPADAPAWLEWWFKDGASAPQPLTVNLDPASPAYFDYEAEEWFEAPRASGRFHVAGPYVDDACTNEYTFTLSVPLHIAGSFMGVVAADVPAAHVEARLLPVLASYPAPIVLVNDRDRVIASNAAEVAPSTCPRPSPGAVTVPSRVAELTGWRLRVG